MVIETQQQRSRNGSGEGSDAFRNGLGQCVCSFRERESGSAVSRTDPPRNPAGDSTERNRIQRRHASLVVSFSVGPPLSFTDPHSTEQLLRLGDGNGSLFLSLTKKRPGSAAPHGTVATTHPRPPAAGGGEPHGAPGPYYGTVTTADGIGSDTPIASPTIGAARPWRPRSR